MTSSTGNESTTRISKFRVRFRFDAYILKISSHVRSAFPSRFRRIAPRSTRLTFDSTSCGLRLICSRWRVRLSRLCSRDVRAGLSLPQGVLIDHVERDRGLHCPRFTGEEDDLTDRDTAVEFLVEPVDERTDSVPLGYAVVSIGRCGYNRSEAVIRGEQRLRTERKRKKERGSNRELKCEGGSGIR